MYNNDNLTENWDFEDLKTHSLETIKNIPKFNKNTIKDKLLLREFVSMEKYFGVAWKTISVYLFDYNYMGINYNETMIKFNSNTARH
jgi:hypothetical protein